MREIIQSFINKVVSASQGIEVEVPKNEKWGDYSTNIGILLAKSKGISPRELAKDLSSRLASLDKEGIFSKIEPTEQGFINFTLGRATIEKQVQRILTDGGKYGSSNAGSGKSVLVEFVSANPTGPLHIGHGRWAVIGDCISRLLAATGNKVEKEFYVNDAGEQIEKLVDSVIARREGKDVPEGGYAGSYVKDLADFFPEELPSRDKIKEKVLDQLISRQKAVLDDLHVSFDNWFYESQLHKKGTVKKAIDALGKKGLTFYEGNALWFKSSEFGDDKNRVLIKDDGSTTYFAADIAYHMDKFSRSDRLINVWGTDHHGYVARLKAAMTALGYPAENLEIIIGQLVALFRGKELVRMSKRTGEMITLEEVITEIGADATRYFLAKNSPNTHLDFDLELAKSKTLENPVYYVGYAHARIISILNEANNVGLKPDSKADLSLLKEEEERKLMIKLIRYEDDVASAAASLAPHRLTAYAESLAAIFHNYYHKQRVISDDKELSKARLALAKSTSIVIKNVLGLLGISAPEHM